MRTEIEQQLQMKEVISSIPKVKRFSFDSLAEVEHEQHTNKAIEGFILVFDDGERVKFKCDDYLMYHRALDEFQYDRHLIKAFIDNKFDDLSSVLPDERLAYAKQLEQHFWAAFSNKLNEVQQEAERASFFTRKQYAITEAPADKRLVGLVYRVLDGYDAERELVAAVKKSLYTNTKYEELMKWLSG